MRSDEDDFFQQQEDLKINAPAIEINQLADRLRRRGFGKPVDILLKLLRGSLKQPQAEVLAGLRRLEASLPPRSD